MISSKVLDLPAGDARDQALEILLERTHQRSRESLTQARRWSEEIANPVSRHSWGERFDRVARDRPWTAPRPLPSMPDFETQTLRTFNQGLELMASMSSVPGTSSERRELQE